MCEYIRGVRIPDEQHHPVCPIRKLERLVGENVSGSDFIEIHSVLASCAYRLPTCAGFLPVQASGQ
jgi:hypothetical protein